MPSDRFGDIRVERLSVLFRNDGRVSVHRLQSMLQQPTDQTERELLIRGVLQQAERGLSYGFLFYGRARLRRFQPIRQRRFELGMTVAAFQSGLYVCRCSDQGGKIHISLTLGPSNDRNSQA